MSINLVAGILFACLFQSYSKQDIDKVIFQRVAPEETVPVPRYPSYFRVDVNPSTDSTDVRSLEITVKSAQPETSSNDNTGPVMYISTSLHDVILQNQNGIGYPFGDPIFGGFGQIERVSVPTHGTTVYVAVTSGGSATSLKVSYVTKFVKEAIKRSVGDSLQAAVQHSLPWHVQLRYTLNDGSSRHFCSAALISKEWVVTAARCFPNGIKDKLKSGSKFLIRLGGHNIDEHDLQLLPFGEEDMFIHKDYNPVTRENDIALIHLREDASISLAIQTIQLPSGESSITIKGGLAATLSGWGSNNPTGELLEATVSMLATVGCKPFVESSGAVYHESVLCTEGKRLGSGFFDTGGPLFAQYNGLYFLIGVASYGASTGTAAYSSMYYFKSWIERTFNSPDKPGNWWSGAIKLPQEYINGGTFIGKVFRGVLHTTESPNYTPSTKMYYDKKGIAPHFTVHIDKSVTKVHQHYPISVASRALRRIEGGPQTNRANAIQIEIAWIAKNAQSMPTELKTTVAELMRWIESRTGIKRKSLEYRSEDAYGVNSKTRMSADDWYNFNGWCGHQHVPDNTHWDPGKIDIQYLLTHHVQEIVYKISVYTSDVYLGGTSASVSIALAGEWDFTQKFTFSSPNSGSFSRGRVGVVNIRTSRVLGSLKRLAVSHDNKGTSPGWYIDKVVVTRTDGTDEYKYTFPCKRWLAVDEDDGRTERVLSVNGIEKGQGNDELTIGMMADGQSDCSTSLSRGLSSQILHQLHCDHPGLVDEIHSIEQLCMPDTVLPYLHKDAAAALKTVLMGSTTSLVVTSALRTVVEQYILHTWSSNFRCGLSQKEDQPGKSDYMKGVALDVSSYDDFKQALSASSSSQWRGISGDTFMFSTNTDGGLQQFLIESFQKLWNANNPKEKLTEDGVYGPITEQALRRSPAKGFADAPSCSFPAVAVPCCVSMTQRGLCVPPNQCHSTDRITAQQECANLPSAVCCAKVIHSSTISPRGVSSTEYVYTIEIFTGDLPNAGTNADIYVSLTGSDGESDRVLLDHMWQNDFERGSTNKYSIISNVNLGEIRGIRIGHNSRLFGSGWYLEQIVVEDLALPSDQKYTFKCECWLDSSTGSTWATLDVKNKDQASNAAHSCFKQVNVYEDKAYGTAVVDAVTRLVDSSSIFPHSKGLLRKIAWVESKFGRDKNTFRTGDDGVGIWQIDSIALQATKDTTSHPNLKEKHDAIKKQFKIEWNSVTTIDLHKPIYCGLAARLLLSNVKESIPKEDDKQAAYWKKYYNTKEGKGTVHKFLKDTEDIPPVASSKDNDCESTTATAPLSSTTPQHENRKGTVKDAVLGVQGCSPVSSYPLAVQIMQQLACKQPHETVILSSHEKLCFSSNAFPYLSNVASSSLTRSLPSSGSGVFTVSEGLEPLPYQYIRWQWSESRLCNVRSAHQVGNGPFSNGMSIRVVEADDMESILSNSQWQRSNNPYTYFTHVTDAARNLTSLQVRAFQELWKANHPQSTITPTGQFDKKTEDALLQAPLAGFSLGAQCEAVASPRISCCTGDKKKGTCIESSNCPEASKRSGPCSNVPNSICCVGIAPFDVQFPSGVTLPSTLPPPRREAEFRDPYDSGTFLFDGTGKETLRASTNFRFREFMDPSSNYFRLSPILVRCLQSVRNKASEPIVVKKGYELVSTLGSSSLYSSGVAAVIRFGTNDRELTLTELVLRHCLPEVRRQGNEIGLGLLSGSIHIDLRNSLSAWSENTISMTTASYEAWVKAKLREIEDRVELLPSCNNHRQLSHGQVYPSGRTDVEICGKIDSRIKRYSQDFSRLIQFAGDQALFENEERSEQWCGVPGASCVDCRWSIAGSSTKLKCADRMMSERLEDRVWRLAQLVKREWPKRKLIVHAAWDDPNSRFPEGSHSANSLHYEGRSASVSVSTEIKDPTTFPPSNDSLLMQLSALAICAGFDHVAYVETNRLQVSVKKSDGVGTVQTFQSAQFLCVLPPASDNILYTINQSDPRWLPTCLHDSDARHLQPLTTTFSLDQFMSPNSSRYFRLHPQLVESVEEISNHVSKTFGTHMSIVKGYQTESTVGDPHRLHHFGQGLEIKLKDSALSTTVQHLASAVVEIAGHDFTLHGFGFGIELGRSSVYYHVSHGDVEAWVTDGSPMTRSDFQQFVSAGIERASRRIEPYNKQRSCNIFPPMRQSPDYQWRASGLDDSPDTSDPSQFCRDTEKYRKDQVDSLWTELTPRHFIRSKQDVKDALTNCMITHCGKYFQGNVWKKKLEHCNNFIHWLPLGFGVTESSGAIYLRENRKAREHACTVEGRNCIEKTEIYSLISPRLEALYPLQEGKSAKEEIYSTANNPSPLFEIMQQVFAMHLEGTVTVWVNDRSEMSSLRNIIKSLMAYNRNVTTVTFYSSQSNVQKVRSWLETNILQWTATVCPQHGREYIADYDVQEMPSLPSKRSDGEEGDGSYFAYSQLRTHEMEWISRV